MPKANREPPKSQNRVQLAAIAVWGFFRRLFIQNDLDQAAKTALHVVIQVDSYIEETQPFKLAKIPNNINQVGQILYDCAEALRIVSVLLWPFIPDACEKYWSRIGCNYYAETLANNGTGKLDEWVRWGQLQPGTPIEKGEALFPRYQVK